VGSAFAVLGGVLADRVGVKAVAVAPRLVVTLLLYPALQLIVSSGSPPVFVAVFAGLMALHAMSGAAGIILIPIIFPAAIRTSGLSIAYALGVTLFGGTAQIVFTSIIAATGDKLSWVWYIIAMSILSFIGTLLIRVPESWAGARRSSRGVAPAGAAGGVAD
jgi:nitrate/nitrite transporter NarK